MKNAGAVLFLFLFGLSCSGGALMELRLPGVQPLTNIVNRLTNTTFGIVRGGLNLFSNTVDRIVNSFGRVEDRLRALLETFRDRLLRGIPELGIPILDPLHIDKIDFDIVHEAAGLKGKAENVTVQHISNFVLKDERLTDMGNLKFKLDMDLAFPFVQISGKYDVDGLVGDMFRIYGNGRFWLNLIDFRLRISAIIKFAYPLKLTALNIDVKLGKLENYLENLMSDKEVGDLINKAISNVAPEALDILWPEIKGPIEHEVRDYVNEILENATIANLARRLFNIIQ